MSDAAVVNLIKQAVVSFDWDDYDLDDVRQLAEEEPDIGVFDALAAHIAKGLDA